MAKIVAVVLLVVTACSTSKHVAAPAPSPSPSGSSTHARQVTSDCPKVTGGQGFAAVDYVDFIQAFGQEYLADFAGHIISPPPRSELGAVLLRSRCSFSALNDRTHKDPGKARDGDTGFVPPGTPIYAINGWPTQCRLAAEHDGRMHVYLAMQAHTAVATPRPCARSK